MPTFPEILYQPAVADIAKSIVLPSRYLTRRSTASAAVNNIFLNTAPNPPDQVLSVSFVHILGSAGLSETVTRVLLFITDEKLNLKATIADVDSTVQLFRVGLNFGQIILMPQETLRAQVQFSAAVAPKTATMDVIGVMYPRANWQDAPTN